MANAVMTCNSNVICWLKMFIASLSQASKMHEKKCLLSNVLRGRRDDVSSYIRRVSSDLCTTIKFLF